MAVEVKRISGRLKELFPKANLSTARLNEISVRLSKMPADDADDAAVDAIINQANEFTPFADIAKADDKFRDLEAKIKKPTPDDPNNPKPEDVLPDDISPAMKQYLDNQTKLMQGLMDKVSGFEQQNQHKSLTEKFTTDERVKNIPAFIRDKYIPTDEAKYDDAINELTEAYTPFATDNKIAALGNDAPAGNNAPPKTEGKVDADLVKFSVTNNETAKA